MKGLLGSRVSFNQSRAFSLNGIEVHYLDLSNMPEEASWLQTYDTVIHTAALNRSDSNSRPEYAEKINVQAVQTLVNLCRKNAVKGAEQGIL